MLKLGSRHTGKRRENTELVAIAPKAKMTKRPTMSLLTLPPGNEMCA
jgi:hypothetical protein